MMTTVDSYRLCQTSLFKRHNEIRIRYVKSNTAFARISLSVDLYRLFDPLVT
jgi:hypothetical protein